MEKRLKLDVSQDGMEKAVARFARSLLASDEIDLVFLGQYDGQGEAVYGTLASDLDPAVPALLMPYMNGNKGREAGLAAPRRRDLKTAVFLRPCEARAFIELSKLKQADRDSVLLVTCDCPGTLSLDDYKSYREKYSDAREGVDTFYAPFRQGGRLEGSDVRECCTGCDSLAHPNSDIRILVVGVPNGEMVIEAGSELGERMLAGLEEDEPGPIDEDARRQFAERQSETRAALDARWDEDVNSVEDLISVLQYCRRCYNCRAECPICYCRECIFQTATFEVTPDAFAKRAEQFGVVKMPPDTLVFHLTRLNHMVTSCVACGQCTEACPQGIPVGRLFTAVGDKVQGVFEYSAGVDPADELPQTVFREDELEPR